MKKIRFITSGVFQTITALCTMSTIKEGESGFLKEEDCVFYRKKNSKKQYLRIRKDAPVYKEQDGDFMLNVCKIENEIEIEAHPNGYFHIEEGFNFDPIDFTAETEIECEEYIKYDTENIEEGQYRVNEIIEESKGFQMFHRSLLEYCYSIEADEIGMEKLVEVIQAEIRYVLPQTKLAVLYVFEEEIIYDENLFEERKERIRERNKINVEDEIGTFRILGDYFVEVKQLLKTWIKQQENPLPENKSTDKLSFDELLDLRDKETDPIKKEELGKIISQRATQTLNVNSARERTTKEQEKK